MLTERLVQVEVNNFSFELRLDRALPRGDDTAPSATDGLGSKLCLRIRHMSLDNAGAEDYGVLATALQVKGVSLEIEQPPLPPASPGRPGRMCSSLSWLSLPYHHAAPEWTWPTARPAQLMQAMLTVAGMHAAAPKVSVVRRWNVSVKVGWRLASGYFDRVQRRRTGEQQAPVLQARLPLFSM